MASSHTVVSSTSNSIPYPTNGNAPPPAPLVLDTWTLAPFLVATIMITSILPTVTAIAARSSRRARSLVQLLVKRLSAWAEPQAADPLRALTVAIHPTLTEKSTAYNQDFTQWLPLMRASTMRWLELKQVYVSVQLMPVTAEAVEQAEALWRSMQAKSGQLQLALEDEGRKLFAQGCALAGCPCPG
ncbi:hypothetical protein OH77DRAFT_1424821 [Trametes cingulata]|nr:hypothetical protein OH77DRAFT_1424821 [Trametes cingulata]